MPNPPLHPVPACTQVGSWQRCPQSDFKGRDNAFEAATAGSILGGSIRLVAGYDPTSRTFNRTPIAYQITEGGPELGFAHMAHRSKGGSLVGNAGQVVTDIAQQLPQVAAAAWGADEAARLRDGNYVNSLLDSEIGGHKAQNDWFLAGWNWANQRPDVRAVQTARWYNDIALPAISWAMQNNITDGRTIAAAIRMRNSSATQLSRLKEAVATLGESGGRMKALNDYGHPDRTAKIESWPEFRNSVPPYPSLGDVQYGAAGPVPPAPGGQVPGPGVPVEGQPAVYAPAATGWGALSTGAKAAIGIAAAAAIGGVGFLAYRMIGQKKPKKRRKRRRRR
jgi:hypothetical protein